jgi:hypothetical protein
MMDKLNARLVSSNTSVNEFDGEIKKGMHTYAMDEDVMKQGNGMLDENANDRKSLKTIEDQRNIIKKVLHKIKSTLDDTDNQ